MAEQTYATHRRYHPLYHFFIIPILGINFLVSLWFAWKWLSSSAPMPQRLLAVWAVIDSLAIVLLAVVLRQYANRTQDRIIRLEETLRLGRVLPADLRDRVGELSTRHLVALRFCHDDELPDLTRAILAGEIHRGEEIKRRIRQWRADHHRV
jgi:hypothetical protein